MPEKLGNASLSMVIDNLETGVVILDREQRILHSNRWLALRSGISSETLSGQQFTEAFPEAANTRLEQAIRHATHDRLPSLLSPALHGTLLPLYQTADDMRCARRIMQMIHVMPLQDDSAASCLIQISDMTANISRERLLRQQTENLRRTTTQDRLTGVANRRQFDETLSLEFAKARKSRLPLGLVIVDIDFFSAYNTHYGREQGDARLIEIAALLNTVARPGIDLVARYGGDEFALILPDQDENQVAGKAEHIRSGMLNLNIAHTSGIDEQLTVSVGATIMAPEGEAEADTHTLLSSADVALYQAKNDGRNRAIFFSLGDGGFRPC